MKINDLAEPTGEAIKFPDLGDKVEGVIEHIGSPYEGINPNNNKTETQVRIVLDVDGESRSLYVRTKPTAQMARAIAEAVKATGNDELEVGGKLAVQFYDTEDTGKPQPMKKYRARYEPPAKGSKVDDWDAAPAKPQTPAEPPF